MVEWVIEREIRNILFARFINLTITSLTLAERLGNIKAEKDATAEQKFNTKNQKPLFWTRQALFSSMIV